MALSNYGELKTSVAAWLGRADLTLLVPDFITQAHKQLMRDLRHPRMQLRNTAFSVTGEYMATPIDFMELVSMTTNTNPTRAITFIPSDQGTTGYGGQAGEIKFVSIVGGVASRPEFRFSPPPSATTSVTLEYFQYLTDFALDADTNWVLTDHPNLYLFSAIYFGHVYLKDAASAAQMFSLYRTELGDVNRDGKRTRWGANGMMVRPG